MLNKARFDAQAGPLGAFLLGSPQNVAEKIKRHSEALGWLNRVNFQMDTANLQHEKLMKAIELICIQVIPMVTEKG